MTDDDPTLYETVHGRRVMTDGGAAAATAPAANTDPAGSLVGGHGFGQFEAQARLAAAVEQGTEAMAANAAAEVAQFRANAQLEKDEWITLDENLIEVAQEELVVVDRLREAGLTINEDLSTLIHEWQTTNEFGDAEISMAAEQGDTEDASTFTLHGTPLPIVHKSFSIPYRMLLASRNQGQALDTQNQTKAARSVMERLDSLAINGWGSSVEGYQAYGLTTHPDRNTQSNTANWSDYGGTSSDAVRGDILDGVEILENDEYGPGNSGFLYFLGRGAFQALRRRDTGTDQERGLLERLRDEFGFVEFVNAPTLDDEEGIMLKPVEDVMELAVASDIQNVEWASDDGFTTHMKVMASITPVVKSDDGGQSGVLHQTNLLS
jgi:hypothetical protein